MKKLSLYSLILTPMLKGCKHLIIALSRLIKLKSMSLRDLHCSI